MTERSPTPPAQTPVHTTGRQAVAFLVRRYHPRPPPPSLLFLSPQTHNASHFHLKGWKSISLSLCVEKQCTVYIYYCYREIDLLFQYSFRIASLFYSYVPNWRCELRLKHM